jgi:hypothetical protein
MTSPRRKTFKPFIALKLRHQSTCDAVKRSASGFACESIKKIWLEGHSERENNIFSTFIGEREEKKSYKRLLTSANGAELERHSALKIKNKTPLVVCVKVENMRSSNCLAFMERVLVKESSLTSFKLNVFHC